MKKRLPSPGTLRTLPGRLRDAVLYPPLRAVLLLIAASFVFSVAYFQFLYGPLSATLLVLALDAYTGLVVYLGLQAFSRRKIEDIRRRPAVAALLRHADLCTGIGIWSGTALSLLYTLFCAASAWVEQSSWHIILALYNLLLFFMNLSCAALLNNPEKAPAREGRTLRTVSFLLLLLGLLFTGISVETILRNETRHWPAFFLIFQVFFTAVRLILYAVDVFRLRRDGNTLRHLMKDVNLSVALVALYTTEVTFAARFCAGELPRLILNLLTSTLVFYFILRLAANACVRARSAKAS